MQRLEVSGAVRPIYGSLGVKRLSEINSKYMRKKKMDKYVGQKHLWEQNTQKPRSRQRDNINNIIIQG
jgi:replication-associated recombination protein RarA